MTEKSTIPQVVASPTLPRVILWRELTILAVVLMDLGWIVPWYRSLTASTYAIAPLQAYVVMGLMILLAYLVVNGGSYFNLRREIIRIGTYLLLIIFFLVGIKTLLGAYEPFDAGIFINTSLKELEDFRGLVPDELVVAFVVFLIWRAGLNLAKERVGPRYVQGKFSTGVWSFVVYSFVITLYTGETPGFGLYLFIFASLVAMGSARIFIISIFRGGSQSPFDRRWLGGLAGASLGVVGLAYVLGHIAGGEAASVLVAFQAVFIGVIAIITSPLISILSLFNSRVQTNFVTLTTISELEAWEATNASGVIIGTPPPEGTGDQIGNLTTPQHALVALYVFIILGLIAAGFVFGIRWFLNRERDDRRKDKEKEHILEPGQFLRILREALFSNLRAAAERFRPRFRYGEKAAIAERIRKIYADLLNLCIELDRPREKAQTPLEYLPVIQRLFPAQTQELGVITNAYLLVRYGGVPETRQEVDAVEKAWKKINTQGQDLLKREKMRDTR